MRSRRVTNVDVSDDCTGKEVKQSAQCLLDSHGCRVAGVCGVFSESDHQWPYCLFTNFYLSQLCKTFSTNQQFTPRCERASDGCCWDHKPQLPMGRKPHYHPLKDHYVNVMMMSLGTLEAPPSKQKA
jgi:hypothetical protein